MICIDANWNCSICKLSFLINFEPLKFKYYLAIIFGKSLINFVKLKSRASDWHVSHSSVLNLFFDESQFFSWPGNLYQVSVWSLYQLCVTLWQIREFQLKSVDFDQKLQISETTFLALESWYLRAFQWGASGVNKKDMTLGSINSEH